MNDDITLAVKALAWTGGLSLLIWICIVMVKAAKKGGGGMQALGAALMMFGWGNMRDSSRGTVAEVQDGRIRKDTTGEPLDRKPPEA